MAVHSVDWKTISRENFDRVVEALLIRQYRDHPTLRAVALDGRGGDEGLDVAVYRDEVVEGVYQLKHFPGGFSGGWSKSRRPQIKSSFETAMTKHGPADWTLVVPWNLTTQERRWVGALRGTESVRIHMIGAAELDQLMIEYPDVAQWATRDDARELLALANREKAGLVGPDDLQERVRELGNLADSRSPFWGSHFSYNGQSVTESFYAKRPDAAEQEPVEFNIKALFGPDQKDLASQFQKMLDYGTLKPLILPPEVVQSFSVSGPEWMARESSDQVSIEIHPIDLDSKTPVELRILDAREGLIASIRGQSVNASEGLKGMTIRTVFRDRLIFEWQVPRDSTESGRVNISYDVTGLDSGDALKILQFIEKMGTGEGLELRAEGKLAWRSTPLRRDEDNRSGVDATLLATASDLAVIEREVSISIPLPTTLTARNLLDIRVTRMLLEGRCIIWPEVGGSVVTIAVDMLDDEAMKMLTTPHGQRTDMPEFALDLDGLTIPIGTVSAYNGNLAAENADDHLAAIASGKGKGRVVNFKPLDGRPFILYMPDRWRDDSRPLVPEPWNLPQLREHPKLAEMRSLEAEPESNQDHGRPAI